jgi:hypothetical protein
VPERWRFQGGEEVQKSLAAKNLQTVQALLYFCQGMGQEKGCAISQPCATSLL